VAHCAVTKDHSDRHFYTIGSRDSDFSGLCHEKFVGVFPGPRRYGSQGVVILLVRIRKYGRSGNIGSRDKS
jgi:hypothetical protein